MHNEELPILNDIISHSRWRTENMDISVILNITNYIFVLIFGIVVSLCLADISWKKYSSFYIITLILFALIQAVFYFVLGETVLYKCYPLLIHIPLILLICFYFHKNILISVTSVLAAYLLCTPRKWFGTLAASFFDGNTLVSDTVSILVTIPLMILVIKYMSPYIIRLKYESKKALLLFFMLPLAYYILEYEFTVYTDLLYTGGAVVIDFMDSFIVVFYFILSMLSLKFSDEKNKAERENLLLTTATSQAAKEIEQLSFSQKQSSIYRHDLRHHMNFIKSCIENNETSQAISYIDEICTGLENSRFIRYCSNEAINLILSSYADKAAAQNITVNFNVTASNFDSFKIADLCSLLANALENALNACTHISEAEQRYINLKIYEKNEQLCINIANSYCSSPKYAPVFKDDIPVSYRPGHGIGVQSMISVMEKYHGLYGFFTDDREFRFQATINMTGNLGM